MPHPPAEFQRSKPFSLLSLAALACLAFAAPAAAGEKTGSAIFLHPDGTGLQGWAACRMLKAGPDGEIAWDRLPHFGIYRGHMKDALVATSHGGATTHAYGVKVPADSYGMHGKEPLKALSGFQGSIMQEAMAAGKAVGVVNSGHIGEPGTGCFLASAPSRTDVESIASQVVSSGAQVIFCGGEVMLLPEGKTGVHGAPGIRRDGRDLIEETRKKGYTVVFTREELLGLDPEKVGRVLGIFAAQHTFHDKTERELKAAGLPLYAEGAPTLAEMVDVALRILNKHEAGFLLVAEEEATDNFANANNAPGTMEASLRADAAIEVAHRFVKDHPDTLLVTAADSDAGGMQVVCPSLSGGRAFPEGEDLLPWMLNGAPLDGSEGPLSPPFVSAPDRMGKRFTFGVAWAAYHDVAGGIVSRAAGMNADTLGATVDNTDIYRILYRTLFGREAGAEK